MQVIIPMSGIGNRFIKAGYNLPKFLINVIDKPVIEWVVKMFDCNDDNSNKFIFICRKEHQEQYDLISKLKKLIKNCQVVIIENHKLGPVYAVSKAFDKIIDDQPCVVSYCDYYMNWNFDDFKKTMLTSDVDGCVPCYHGFHPHLLPPQNLYAGCKIDDDKNLLGITEKFSYTTDKSQGYHSPGVYYFKNAKLLKKYFQLAFDNNLSLNNEFYVSMVYQLMLKDNLKISVYDKIKHFCQWGTPEDLEDFLSWINLIKNLKK